jgi:hypothetical protein
MMAMTKEEWQQVQKELSLPWARVVLQCGEDQITLQVQRESTLRYCIMLYVDGWFRGNMTQYDSDVRRRFMCPNKHFYYGSKAKREAERKKQKELLSIFGKKKAKQFMGPEPDKIFFTYSPYWFSFQRLKSHLVKNNPEITLVPKDRDVGAMMATAIGKESSHVQAV